MKKYHSQTQLMAGFFYVLQLSICVVASLLLSSNASAADQDKDQALSISAAKAEIDEKNGWAIYSGEVVLEQGSLAIRCDRLQIFRSAVGVDKVVATGKPAAYTQQIRATKQDTEPKTIEATAEQITYELESRSIELDGNAKIRQGDNLFEGHSILYQIDNRKIIAKSGNTATENAGQRVKIVLPVRKKQRESQESKQE